MSVVWQTETRQVEEAGRTGAAAQGPPLLLYELRQVTAPPDLGKGAQTGLPLRVTAHVKRRR